MTGLGCLWFRLPKQLRITIILMATVVLWHAAVIVFAIQPVLVPSPVTVLRRFAETPEFYAIHSWRTLVETLVGFAVAVVLGVVLAMLIVSSRFLEETVLLLLIAFNAIPKVAIAPLFVVWLGTGLMPKFAISATIAVFVIVIDLVAGFQSVDKDMLDLARSLNGSRWKTLRLIQFPHALPHLFSGMKVATMLALIGAVVGEFVASDSGLGYLIMLAQGSFDTVQIFASLLMLGLIGMLLFYVVEFLERLALPWHTSQRIPGGEKA
jgi:NitT/TauT family transport system permease protein